MEPLWFPLVKKSSVATMDNQGPKQYAEGLKVDAAGAHHIFVAFNFFNKILGWGTFKVNDVIADLSVAFIDIT